MRSSRKSLLHSSVFPEGDLSEMACLRQLPEKAVAVLSVGEAIPV